MEEKYVKKIKLSDGSTYFVFDASAPRKTDLDNYIPKTGGTITGNLDVDKQIKAGSLSIQSVEFVSQTTPDNVLVQSADGTIKKRSTDKLLEDIGGCSYKYDDLTGTLSFKIGKQ